MFYEDNYLVESVEITLGHKASWGVKSTEFKNQNKTCALVSRPVMENYHRPDGLKKNNFFTMLEARWLGTRCSWGHVPYNKQGTKNKSLQSNLWYSLALLWSLPRFLHVLPCVYIGVFSYGITHHTVFRTHLNLVWLHLNLITPLKTLFPNYITL